jgi:hypothetical protein
MPLFPFQSLSVDMVHETKSTVGIIVVLGLIGSVAAIVAGGFMVYFGATGGAIVEIFDQKITTTSPGVACVFLGIVALIVIIRGAFQVLEKAIAAPESKGHHHKH